MRSYFFFLLVLSFLALSCNSADKEPISFQQENTNTEENTNNTQLIEAPHLAENPVSPVETTISPTSPAQTENGIRFVAYNLWNYLDSHRRRGDDKGKPQEEIDALLEVIEPLSPHILGICEIGTEEDLLDFQQQLKKINLDLPYSSWTTGEDGERNLGILSAFPIIAENHPEQLSYNLPHNNGQVVSTKLERGILDVSIALTEDYTLRLLGIHFKSKNPVSYADQELIRLSEAQLLREYADSILQQDPETNLLVYGDFNDTRRTPAVETVRGPREANNPLSLFDLKLEDDRGERWTHYWQRQDIYSCFDYIFYNNALRPELIQEASGIASFSLLREASDHRPIYTVIDPSKEEPESN